MASRDILTGSAELNWIEDLEMFEWQGIALGGSPPRVTELDLSFSLLSGRIPSELGLLTNLRQLNLEGNRLTGGIPPELGDLGQLRRLNLRSNSLTGSIPSELGNLGNLMFLSIGDNLLIGGLPLGLIKRLRESQFYRDRGRKIREARQEERELWYYYDDPRYCDDSQSEVDNVDEDGMREWEEEMGDWFGWPWTDEDNYNKEAPG